MDHSCIKLFSIYLLKNYLLRTVGAEHVCSRALCNTRW